MFCLTQSLELIGQCQITEKNSCADHVLKVKKKFYIGIMDTEVVFACTSQSHLQKKANHSCPGIEKVSKSRQGHISATREIGIKHLCCIVICL